MSLHCLQYPVALQFLQRGCLLDGQCWPGAFLHARQSVVQLLIGLAHLFQQVVHVVGWFCWRRTLFFIDWCPSRFGLGANWILVLRRLRLSVLIASVTVESGSERLLVLDAVGIGMYV